MLTGSGSGGGSACGGGHPDTAVVSIERLDNLSEYDSSVAVFRVTRGTAGPATFSVDIAFSGSANPSNPNQDYSGAVTSVTFGYGETYKDISLSGIVDSSPEDSEEIIATIEGTTAEICIGRPLYTVDIGSATAHIFDGPRDKPFVTVTASPGEITEAGEQTATFTFSRIFTLSNSYALTVYYTLSGDASSSGAGADYSASPSLSGSITIDVGEWSEDVVVTAIDDSHDEPLYESIVVTITDVDAYDIWRQVLPPNRPGIATVEIVDDDVTPPSLPVVSITGPGSAVTEGNNAVFTISISAQPGSGSPVTVRYDTQNSTAVSPGDYAAAGNTVTFTSADWSAKTVTIPAILDALANEPNEQFKVALSNPANATLDSPQYAWATIVDATPLRAIHINDVIVSEPVSGSVNAVFTVTASGAGAAAPTVTVNYATADDTATTSTSDYNSASGTLTFTGSELSKTITVVVNADSAWTEVTEFYNVLLSNASSGAVIGDSSGLGTILNRSNTDGDLWLILDGTTCACTCACSGQTPIDPKQAQPVIAPEGLPGQPALVGDGTHSTQAVFNVMAQFDPTRTLNTADVRLKINGTWKTAVAYHGYNTTHTAPLVFTQKQDLSALASGGYPVEIEVVAHYSNGDTTRAKSGYTHIVNNEADSPFAPRWWLFGLDRLVVTASGSNQGAALIRGSGSAAWFAKPSTSYVPTDGTFSSLVQSGVPLALTLSA